MQPLTPNDLKQLDKAALLLQAQAIRDAVAAKTVSARQVGELFCGLIEACADSNEALGGLLTNLPEILTNIDRRLSAPLRVDIISAPETITLGNPVRRQIRARLFPRFALGSLLCISDNQALEVSPDGFITPLRPGRSYVNAVATSDTSVYKTLCIDVVPPRCRLTASGTLRLDSAGNIRLT